MHEPIHETFEINEDDESPVSQKLSLLEDGVRLIIRISTSVTANCSGPDNSSTSCDNIPGVLMKVLRNLQGKSKRIPKTSASIASSQTTNCIYYFGSFSLNEAEQRLLCNGEPVRLAPKAFDVLRVLIHNRGCLVTKERLLEEVWPDAFVEEANLSVNVASLRKALDKGDEWRCIELFQNAAIDLWRPCRKLRTRARKHEKNLASTIIEVTTSELRWPTP
jgi:DNA-binding winged helix-turn-helix (wHTH) protein